MRNFLPNSGKARFLLAFLVLLAVAGLFFLFPKKQAPISKPSWQSDEEYKKQVEKLSLDGDGDGLKDWEEGVYRTDAHNSDTDGDKTTDGEEIQAGRDPLRAGPNDMPEKTAEVSRGPDLNNLTEKLAASFNANYVIPSLVNKDLVLDPEEMGYYILENSLADVKPAVPAYTLKDLTIAQDNSNEKVKEYGEALAALVSLSFSSLHDTSELVILSKALRTGNFSSLAILDHYVAAYDELSKNLKNLPVPSEFAQLHLDYLNATAAQKIAVEKIRAAEKDTVGGILGVQEFVKNASVFEASAKKFNEETARRGIL